MQRRGFLAGILAAGMAPAIVHNPMKIWVPKEAPSFVGLGRGFTTASFVVPEEVFTADAIHAKIIEEVREMAFRLYMQSGYAEAALAIEPTGPKALRLRDRKFKNSTISGYIADPTWQPYSQLKEST